MLCVVVALEIDTEERENLKKGMGSGEKLNVHWGTKHTD